jgi:hypothetical protein
MAQQQQKPQQSQDRTQNRDLDADFRLNQHVFKTVAYTGAGLGLGLVASLFFKHKALMMTFGGGAGFGYGLSGMASDLSSYKRIGSYAREQGQGQQRRGDQFGRNFQDQSFQNQVSSATQGAKDLAGKALNQASETYNQAKQEISSKVQESTSGGKREGGQQGSTTHHRSDAQDTRSSQGQDQGQKGQQQSKGESSSWKREESKPSGGSQGGSKSQDSSANKGKQDDKGGRADETKIGNIYLQQGASQQRGNQTEGGEQGLLDKQSSFHETRSIEESRNAARVNTQGYQGSQNVHIGKEREKTLRDPGFENKTETKQGQHFQDFKSNPTKLGESDPLKVNTEYQRGRNRANDPEAVEQKRRDAQLEQDKLYQSVKQGNNIRVDARSETQQGAQNYKQGVGTTLTHNRQEAVIE